MAVNTCKMALLNCIKIRTLELLDLLRGIKMKKKKSFIVIAFCLIIIVIVTLLSFSDNPRKIPDFEGRSIWVKCTEGQCGATYQMELNQYFEELKTKQKTWAGFGTPGLTCEKCGNDSAYRAIKCEKCGTIFRRVAGRGTFADRCPECGFSKTQEDISRR